MAITKPTTSLSGLALILVQEKLLTESEVITIQSQAAAQKNAFITQAIASKKITSEKIAITASKAFSFPYFNLDVFSPDYLPAKSIDTNLMEKIVSLHCIAETMFYL